MSAVDPDLARDVVEVAELEARAYRDLYMAAYIRGFVRGPLVASGRKSLRIADIEAKLSHRTVLRCGCCRYDIGMCKNVEAGVPIVVERVVVDDKLTIRRVEAGR